MNEPTLPADLDAERAVLGAILVDDSRLVEVRGILAACDFHRSDHGRIFAAMIELADDGQPVDLVTVCGRLGDKVAAPVVSALTDGLPKSARAVSYAQRVKETARRRTVLKLATGVCESAGNGVPFADVLRSVHDLADLGRAFEETGHGGTEAYDWTRLDVLEAVTVEPTPTDWTVKGIVGRGEAVTLNAQGGLGKTYLLLQLAIDAALGRPALGVYEVSRPLKVLHVDEEMGAEMLKNRLSRLACGNHLEQADLELLAANLDIRPQQGLLLADPVCAAVYDRALREGAYDLVIMDSLIALDPGNEKDGNEARAFYRQFVAPYKGTLGTSFLIAAHPPKASKEAHPDAQKMTRGSIDKRNSMDRTFWLEKQSEAITEDSHVLRVILHRDKQRQAGSVDGHLIEVDGPADKPVAVRSLGETGSPAAVESIGKVNACQHEILTRLRAADAGKVYQPDLIAEIEKLGYDKRRHYQPAVNSLVDQRFVRVLEPIPGSGQNGKWVQLRDLDDAE